MSVFTLGLDLDGVTADYVQEFRLRVARYTSCDPADLPAPTTWSFVEAWGPIRDNDHYLELHRDAVRDGLFRSMAPMPGVSRALWDLSDADVHIRVVTHRLIGNNLHKEAAADTLAWLDRHEIPFRDILFLGVKSDLEASVFIDDAPHNVVALTLAGRDVIVFDAPYNRTSTDPQTHEILAATTRVHNWDEAREAVLERKRAFDAN